MKFDYMYTYVTAPQRVDKIMEMCPLFVEIRTCKLLIVQDVGRKVPGVKHMPDWKLSNTYYNKYWHSQLENMCILERMLSCIKAQPVLANTNICLKLCYPLKHSSTMLTLGSLIVTTNFGPIPHPTPGHPWTYVPFRRLWWNYGPASESFSDSLVDFCPWRSLCLCFHRKFGWLRGPTPFQALQVLCPKFWEFVHFGRPLGPKSCIKQGNGFVQCPWFRFVSKTVVT